MNAKTHRISGSVIDRRTSLGIPGLRVEAWDKDLLFDGVVGKAQTDASGSFNIEFTETRFRECFLDRRPDLYFKVYQRATLLASTEDSVLWNAGSETTSVTIEVGDAAVAVDSTDEARNPEVYIVRGTVVHPDRPGIAGLQVQVVDKNVGEDVPLADTTTDDRGHYQTTFSAARLRERGKSQPDLQSRVYSRKTFLAASDIRYSARANETLDVTLPATSAALPSEHETLTRSIAAHFGGKLGDLQDTGDRQDITYLANKTGWDARAVALAALADQLGRNSGDIPAVYFYALFRAGLAANEDTIYHTDSRTLQAAWKDAIAKGAIPQSAAEDIPRITARFQELSTQRILAGPASTGVSPVKDMLAISGLNEVQQRQFTDMYATHRADLPKLWEAATEAFGKTKTQRLQVDGKLATLTVNNAPLIRALHGAAGKGGVSDPLQLARGGYHRADKWNALLADGVAVPEEMPGATSQEKRANYAEFLAAQVRLSYPTASVAEMMRSENPNARLRHGQQNFSDATHRFLAEHQADFAIGVQPIQQYVASRKLQVADDTVQQIMSVHRAYQITPSDQAMRGLLKRGIDNAGQVVRYGKEAFVREFTEDLGDAEQAAITYDRSVQVHNAVLNIAVSYLSASTAPPIGRHSPTGTIAPAPTRPASAIASDIIPYATLESLFGSMDFCACAHCRSILSPAAYLVDLLNFIDIKAPKSPALNPQDVLFTRRPDIQHLPLTCENTNTVLPYIDLVNETLEYFTGNTAPPLSLQDYTGYDTDSAASDDLLAAPQNVIDGAYTTLGSALFPAPLPFNRSLEFVRRYFNKLEVPLPLVMERLRKNDDLERGANAYGWRDILVEELGLSRAEHRILTNSPSTVPLWQLYGFKDVGVPPGRRPELGNAKQYCRRMGITYEDFVAILKTRFVNPSIDLLPKLQRLGPKVTFEKISNLQMGTLTDADFSALLVTGTDAPDSAGYGGPIPAWVRFNSARIMALITLKVPVRTWQKNTAYPLGACVVPTPAHPLPLPQGSTFYFECTVAGTSHATEPSWWPTTPGKTAPDGSVTWTSRDASNCSSFDNLALRYVDPIKLNEDIDEAAFTRLLRFIRLWKKLDWTVEQTDAAICALLPRPHGTQTLLDTIDTVGKLDAGFLLLLSRLGILKRVMKALDLEPQRDLLPLLSCWSDIGTHGDNSVYRQMFLNSAIFSNDPAFADNGYGEFLTDPSARLLSPKARVGGSMTIGDVLTTTINGLAIPYMVTAADTSLANLAQQIALKVNATTDTDSATGLPLNEVLRASIVAGNVAFQALPPATSFSLECRVSPNATETYTVLSHEPALRAALKLTGEELRQIAGALGFDTVTPLSLSNVSAILRRGWLARKLKVSVRELLLLTKWTGLDPFAVPTAVSDLTNPAMLGLINLLQGLSERSLRPSDILYLIWNQDLSGKSAPDPEQTKALARTLRSALRAIENEFAVTDDPDGSIAQARMALVYGSDAASFFFGLLNGSFFVELDFDDRDGTLAQGKPAEVALWQAIRTAGGKTDAGDWKIAFDAFRKRLSYSGVLTTAVTGDIKTAAGMGATAFRKVMDDLLEKSQGAIAPFFDRYPELLPIHDAFVADTTHAVAEKRAGLLPQILPDLVDRRKRQQALQVISAATNTDPAFAVALLGPATAPSYPLHAAGLTDTAAVIDFLGLEKGGLSVVFYASNTPTGTVIPASPVAATLDYAPLVGGVGNALPVTGKPISGIWSGQLEAPESGFYTLRIETDKDATVAVPVTVTLDLGGRSVHLQKTVSARTLIWTNSDRIELRAGALYAFTFKVAAVRTILRVQWEWEPKGHGCEVVPARYLYPATQFNAFRDVYVRFLKAASLATGLGLAAGEIAHFSTEPGYQVGGDDWLNALPITGDPTMAVGVALLRPLKAHLDYARIKAVLSPGDDRLLAVVRGPAAPVYADGPLFALTRWDEASLNGLLTQFGGTIAGLSQIDLFRRVHDAYALLRKTGLGGRALIAATTNEPASDIVRDMQAALRASYEASAWRDLVKPINDEMRGLQRDALVAHILHRMRSDSTTAHIDTAEKLFEYFLMDVQMEPCMQTSRVRHALSAVQLFIERCLMNLEHNVAPTDFDAEQWKQWNWMKRYRVWEANRKVFLFPENWLEPELRDDKSPFFREIESELLQSDITEESAATALLNYLGKLEEVAKLEPCGIHHDEKSNVVHVVARTAGAHRKYYYRRRDGRSWTPWEQIKLDIEDNPVIPYVWANDHGHRLMLFWLKIIKQGPDTSAKPLVDKTVTELKISDLRDDPQITIKAVLCWSEYYNGKWQAAKTSDINNPTFLGTYESANPFLRSTLSLHGNMSGDVLLTRVGDLELIYFACFNTHSLPVRVEDDVVRDPAPGYDGRRRIVRLSNPTLTCDYKMAWESAAPQDRQSTLIDIGQSTLPLVVVPTHDFQSQWKAPFLFADSRHVFFVETSTNEESLALTLEHGALDKIGRTIAPR